MDVFEIISLVIGSNVITNAISTWFSWRLAKKKYNAEVDHDRIDNLQKSLDFYQTLCDDNQKRLDMLLDKIEQKESEIRDLQIEIRDLYKIIGIQTKEELITLKDNQTNKLKTSSRKKEVPIPAE